MNPAIHNASVSLIPGSLPPSVNREPGYEARFAGKMEIARIAIFEHTILTFKQKQEHNELAS